MQIITPTVTPALVPDLAEAAVFMATLTGSADTDVTWQTFADNKTDRETGHRGLIRILHGTLDQHAAELTRLNRAGAGIFVTVNETDLQGRTTANIRRVRAAFADCDEVDPELPIPPSMTVQSARGKHHYWLTDDLDLDDFKPLQQAIAALLGSDTKVHDLPRVMRMPGFWHRKGEPFMVRILASPGTLYAADELREAFPAPTPLPPTADFRERMFLRWSEHKPSGQGAQNNSIYEITAEGLARGISTDAIQRAVDGYCLRSGHDATRAAATVVSATRRHAQTPFRSNEPDWRPAGPAARPPTPTTALAVGIDNMLDRYLNVEGTTQVFDLHRRRFVANDALKSDYPRDAKTWTEHPHRRTVDIDDIVFEPAGCGHGQINLWSGFDSTPNDSPHDLITAHLAWCCNFSEPLMHWLTCWLAYPLQHPGAKLRTAVVLVGDQGTGKNLLIEPMRHIYGRYSSVFGNMELESAYWSWASQKLFGIGNEISADARARRSLSPRLKAVITDPTLMIEEKYKPSRNEANHINFVFTSNALLPVTIEATDRRWCVIETPAKLEQGYYDALADQIHAGGWRGWWSYLLAYPLDDFNPSGGPPVTAARQNIKDLSRESYDAFLDDWIANDESTAFPYITCTPTDLYQAYGLWCRRSGYHAWGAKAFQIATNKRLTSSVVWHMLKNVRVYLAPGNPDIFAEVLRDALADHQKTKI